MTKRPVLSRMAPPALDRAEQRSKGRVRDPGNARASFIVSLVAIAAFLVFAIVLAVAALLTGS